MTPVEKTELRETAVELYYAGVTLEEALEDLSEEEQLIVGSEYSRLEEINGAIAVCEVVGELKARVDSFISKKEAKE